MFIFFEACRDFVIVPKLVEENGVMIEINVTERHRDFKGAVDQYIKFYREKYNYDTTYFGLKSIQENSEDGNFLQYVKNGTTFLITVGTDIIIEFVRIYYIYVREVNAKGKRIYSLAAALRNPLEPFDRAQSYPNLIMAVIVVKKTVNIITGVINYENNFRWIINQHTLNNMTQSGNTIPDIFLKNFQEVRLKDYSTATKVAKSTTDYFRGLFGGPSAAVDLPEEGKGKESFAIPGSGLKLESTQSSSSSSSSSGKPTAAAGIEESGEVAQGEVGGRKKNKTRKRSIKRKRSNKRKTKY